MKKLGKKLMKKPAAAMKKTKNRSACIKRPAMTSASITRRNRDAVRKRRYREKVLMNKEHKKKKNVLTKAKRAASDGVPYRTKSLNLVDVAADAYAAKVAANSARQAADEAKKDAAEAKAIGLENCRRIIVLEGEVRAEKKSLAETAARANRNEAALKADDRMRGYETPPRRYSSEAEEHGTPS